MEKDHVLLITANDEIEAKIIQSKLRYYDMPVLLKHRGAGSALSVIAGFSRMPVDIYVRADDFEDALDIMNINE